MQKRLVLCFDGTWNSVKDHTNVSRIHAAIHLRPENSDQKVPQLKYYDEGVGTHIGSKLTGGVFGVGLSKNICQGYAWLMRHYQKNDQIYLFGFSRGAYTARSLAGMIGRCGIYKECNHSGDSRLHKSRSMELAQQVMDLYKKNNKGGTDPMAELGDDTQSANIHFMGVWDTVGALGVPLLNLNFAESFFDTKLGSHVDHAYHALAIDEHRKDYQATLWTHIPEPERQTVEQRWFPGAHANVGGGYADDLLPDMPLNWIAHKAHECGLELDLSRFRLDGSEYRSPVRDSFAEFGFGLYQWIKLKQHHYRPIGEAVAEVIDTSAIDKWNAESAYRPQNLAHTATPVVDGDAQPPAPAHT
ncbi:MAG: DUF2235 domain-containing protein [Candidatus Thiodiazotropha sp.]|jgi:uncharacterized protein (DUF2235 family)